MLLVISGIAVVGFSIIPKPPEEWTNSFEDIDD
jgi:hypothetical protein